MRSAWALFAASASANAPLLDATIRPVTSDEHLHLMRFGLSLSSGRGGAGVTTLFGRTAAFAMATFLSLLGPDLEGELLELTSDDEEPEDCPGLPMLGSAGGRLPWCSRVCISWRVLCGF